jgi:hypothetical protein
VYLPSGYEAMWALCRSGRCGEQIEVRSKLNKPANYFFIPVETPVLTNNESHVNTRERQYIDHKWI